MKPVIAVLIPCFNEETVIVKVVADFRAALPALKWQRIKPYEKFAEMIERHWADISRLLPSDNKVARATTDR
ncbi:MAG: hypothetical protein ACREV4_06170 [Gammaproteobacteria bacterium]